MKRIQPNGLHIIGRRHRARPAQLLSSVRELGDTIPEFVFICTKACDIGTA